MPKKPISKKISKKEESEDEYDDEDIDIDENDEEIEEEEEEDEDNDEDVIIEPETDQAGCAIEDAIEDDDEYFDNNDETEVHMDIGSEYVTADKRISLNRLTKYEMVRILGERTKQLNMIPFKIKRPLPNGKFEIWTLDELFKDHLLSQLE